MTTYRVIRTPVGDALVGEAADDHRELLWRVDLDRIGPDAWPVLVAVLTQPPGVVDRVAASIADAIRPGWWTDMPETHREWYRRQARAVLTALRSLPDDARDGVSQ